MFGLAWISYKIVLLSVIKTKQNKQTRYAIGERFSFCLTSPTTGILADLEGDVNHCIVECWPVCLWKEEFRCYLGWVVFICLNKISLQNRKWSPPPPSFIALGGRGGGGSGLCPPALENLRSSLTRQLQTEALWRKTVSQKTDQIWQSSATDAKEQLSWFRIWNPRPRCTWSSVQSCHSEAF